MHQQGSPSPWNSNCCSGDSLLLTTPLSVDAFPRDVQAPQPQLLWSLELVLAAHWRRSLPQRLLGDSDHPRLLPHLPQALKSYFSFCVQTFYFYNYFMEFYKFLNCQYNSNLNLGLSSEVLNLKIALFDW